MNTPKTPLSLPLPVRALLRGGALLFTLVTTLQAGSATWNLSPTNGDWNTAANWTPATVPNSPSDIATFANSTLTDIFASANTQVSSVVFASGAASFTVTPNIGTSFTISGEGVVNDSGTAQSFVMAADANFNHASLIFIGAATAGNNMTTYINKAAAQGDNFGGITAFGDMANAGSATFVTEGGIFPDSRTVGGYMEFDNSASAGTATLITGGGTFFKAGGGEVAFFFGSPTAANATIINNPGEAERAQGGILEFEYSSTAGHAVITNNGASIDGAFGGSTTFEGPSRADHSTLIANGGSNGGGGGVILFGGGSFGDFARVEVFGNGTLDVENVGGSSGLTIGSLEGDGRVSMGGGPLIVGSNNLSTVFGGMIFDSSFGGGALIKMGRGTLSLITPNTYTGDTIVWEGTLAVRNQHGSPTGTGSVSVKGGNLIGRGIIAGSVVIGTNNGRSSAVLSPGNNPANPQTLTIQSDLTFNMGSTYTCDLNSDSTFADKVVAAGVLIVGDAQISLNDAGSAMLPLGTAFIVLENSSANPISGTFSNLADGSTITVGSNTFQASYEGGDGNDLTLTVE